MAAGLYPGNGGWMGKRVWVGREEISSSGAILAWSPTGKMRNLFDLVSSPVK